MTTGSTEEAKSGPVEEIMQAFLNWETSKINHELYQRSLTSCNTDGMGCKLSKTEYDEIVKLSEADKYEDAKDMYDALKKIREILVKSTKIFYIDVQDRPSEESIEQYIKRLRGISPEDFKKAYQNDPLVNPETGDINTNYIPKPVSQDYFIPNREKLTKAFHDGKFRGCWDYNGYEKYMHLLPHENDIKRASSSTLVSKINELSAQYFKLRLESPDCLVVSPEVHDILAWSDFYQISADDTTPPGLVGFSLTAELGHRYKVYVDAYMPGHMTILGKESELIGPEEVVDCAVIYIDHLPKYGK